MGKWCDRAISPREAVEMVQRCRKDRLPYVLDILRTAGYEFTQQEANMDRALKITAEQVNAENRKSRKNSWAESDDEATVLLRRAYLIGVKFTDISRLTGINRTVLYEYLKGERSVPFAYRDRLIGTLKELLERIGGSDG